MTRHVTSARFSRATLWPCSRCFGVWTAHCFRHVLTGSHPPLPLQSFSPQDPSSFGILVVLGIVQSRYSFRNQGRSKIKSSIELKRLIHGCCYSTTGILGHPPDPCNVIRLSLITAPISFPVAWSPAPVSPLRVWLLVACRLLLVGRFPLP